MHSNSSIRFTCLFLAIVSALNANAQSDPVDTDRVNIVFAFADDLGRYASAYADPDGPSPNDLIQTPHFDAVARDGALFDNAFVSVPSCTPSRAAFLTGRHFFRNGSHSQLHHPWYTKHPHYRGLTAEQQADPWEQLRGLGLTLSDAGYHIGWSYKMHLSEDRMGGKERNYVVAGKRFNSFSQVVDAAEDVETAKNALLDEVRKNFQAFLKDREGDQPFFYWFNPTNTHRSWVQGSGKRLWGLDPDQLKGRLPRFLPDDDVIREDFADYLGEAMAFDAAVGVLIEQLKAIDQWDKTLLLISGDHGAPGFPRGKCNLYDFGTRVPLAMRLPSKIQAGVRIETPVSLVDLAPTFLNACGVEPAEPMDGESLLPAIERGSETTSQREAKLRGWVLSGRENHVDEARPGGLPYPMRSLRNRDYLYVINFAPDRWPVAKPPLSAPLLKSVSSKKGRLRRRMDLDFGPTRDFFVRYEGMPEIEQAWQLGFARREAEELYDVQKDPDQMTNLASDPAYEDIRKQLRQQLMQQLRRGQDPRVVTQPPAFDYPPYTRGDTQAGEIAD